MTHSPEFQRLLTALERGRQRKAAYQRQQNGQQVFGNVAVQKVEGQYLVNVMEVDESMIDIDQLLRDETSHHQTVAAALQHIAASVGVAWTELKSAKGQKTDWPS